MSLPATVAAGFLTGLLTFACLTWSFSQHASVTSAAADERAELLLERASKASALHQADLGDTTLGKSCALSMSSLGNARQSPLALAPRASPQPQTGRAEIRAPSSSRFAPLQRLFMSGGTGSSIVSRSGFRRPWRTQATADGISYGESCIQGTSRKQNEDRVAVDLAGVTGNPTPFEGMFSVFDGHGGTATSEWLKENMHQYIKSEWPGRSPEESLTEANLKADVEVLKSESWFAPRGLGGDRCGASAATFLVLPKDSETGKRRYLTSNVGDSRVYLLRGTELVQLTEDHVPDDERERNRIERYNPNLRMPMVRKVGDTWRLGGLLALSRAFGDATFKSTGQFEGVTQGSDGYSSGFGLISEPFVSQGDLEPEDTYAIISTDGLFANVERGGGSGLSAEQLTAPLLKKPQGEELKKVAQDMAKQAQEAGSLDDVTVIIVKL
eukprot:gnl/TRDRNA2_/TRDRNA2_42900_c0_seq1.p1 gnl/TRDRNA2_/TRDRNA2_42900_c0~~gnl/TRDRNA2_/TRDRNA2_42900_c0_seq1.p1  ORF type:complete len:451 (-),score=45.28 gnl/TRDRNA2_/TRDRNA2_42900_c0_seq1:41-1363(-)